MAELSIGDKVVHPLYGVGTLVSVVERRNNGAPSECYVVKLIGDKGRLETPVAKAEELGLRRVVSKRSRRELSSVLMEHPKTLADDYRKRRRDIADRLREGSFAEVGRVVRDLAWRAEEGKATVGDRKLLERARELLAAELAASADIGQEEAIARIESVLERAFSE